jgi:nicotinamide-nucleotide amidase
MNTLSEKNISAHQINRAEVIVIGDEIISGEIDDTNSAYIAEKLTEMGIEVKRIVTVGDDKEEIEFFVKNSLKDVDLIITTGGLGITVSDITKQVIADLFKKELVIENSLFEKIKKRYENLGYKKIPERVVDYTKIPSGAKVFPNSAGTAPGLLIEVDGKELILLPGVPQEMMAIMNEYVIPYLIEKAPEKIYLTKIIRTTGIGETMLAEILNPIIKNWENPSITFLAKIEGVDIRLRVRGVERDEAEKLLEDAKTNIIKHIEEWVYSTEDESLIDVVSKLLKEKGLTIALAESCTGGSISSGLTDISGSSSYFISSIVSYNNDSKTKILGVSEDMIKRYGAVSSQVAVAMAEGIKKISGTDIGLSTTGIFGPTGGTPEKPVGLVYIGYSDGKDSIYKEYQFGNDRARSKIRTTQEALNLLRKKIIENY